MCICGSLWPEFSPARLQSQIAARVATLAKTLSIFQRQQVDQRDQGAHALHLGAYRIPPETGLLLPSAYNSYLPLARDSMPSAKDHFLQAA